MTDPRDPPLAATTPGGTPDGHAPGPPRAADTARWGRHPAVRAVALTLGGLLTLAALAVGGLGAANALVRTSESDTVVLEGPVRRATVHVDGRVRVRPGPEDRATVTWSAGFGLERPDITHTLVDGLLTVRIRCGEGISFVCDPKVDLAVPPGTSLTVGALGIDARDMDAEADLDSGAGHIRLDGMSGRLDLSVGGGAIIGRRLRSEEVRATAGAGSVELGFDTAPRHVEADAGAGSVVIGLPPGDEAYRVDATSATSGRQVDVRTDPTSDRVIRAHAGAGAVEVRYRA